MKYLILFIFLISCTSLNSNNGVKKNNILDFSEDKTFEEFNVLILNYAETNPYPNIDN